MLQAILRLDSIVLVVAFLCFVLGAWLTLREEVRQHQEHNRVWR